MRFAVIFFTRLVHAQRDAVEQNDQHAHSFKPRKPKLRKISPFSLEKSLHKRRQRKNPQRIAGFVTIQFLSIKTNVLQL